VARQISGPVVMLNLLRFRDQAARALPDLALAQLTARTAGGTVSPVRPLDAGPSLPVAGGARTPYSFAIVHLSMWSGRKRSRFWRVVSGSGRGGPITYRAPGMPAGRGGRLSAVLPARS